MPAPSAFTTLISAASLQTLIDQAAPMLLIDASFDLTDTEAGEHAYLEAHLPGAHYLHLGRDLSGPKERANGHFPGRHPLPSREAFANTMASLGLRAAQQVVCYDAQGGFYAARLWWMLRWIGHEAAAVLDGGLQAWREHGGALTAECPSRHPAPPCLSASLAPSVDADTLLKQLGRVRVIDARAPERFRGDTEPLDTQAGHIPGASNRVYKNNLQADGRFKSAEQLRQEFEALIAPYPVNEVVHQCGSGVTACHNMLAMTHAGLQGSLLYPGSWSEWCNDPSKPIAKG